jgi:hypothetical protein
MVNGSIEFKFSVLEVLSPAPNLYVKDFFYSKKSLNNCILSFQYFFIVGNFNPINFSTNLVYQDCYSEPFNILGIPTLRNFGTAPNLLLCIVWIIRLIKKCESNNQ